jgi:hypothetical protein
LKDELGWHLEKGTRPHDFYACPKGVVRGEGFKNRVDFFDSVLVLMKFIKTDPRWKDKPEVKQCLKLYSQCVDLLTEMRRTKKLPQFSKKEDLAEWLKQQVKDKNVQNGSDG